MRDEFIKLIESIGFYSTDEFNYYYKYKEFRIDLYTNDYFFYNGSEWIYNIPLNDLKPIENNFKNYFRSIKLKELLI